MARYRSGGVRGWTATRRWPAGTPVYRAGAAHSRVSREDAERGIPEPGVAAFTARALAGEGVAGCGSGAMGVFAT